MADSELWRDRNKVFVAGLPAHADDAALYDKFRPFGEMHQSKVVLDSKTGRSRGFGFVTFCEYVHALDAVEKLDQSKWDKRTLNVRFLQPKAAGGGGGGGDAKATAARLPVVVRAPKVIGPRPDGCTTVYVGNLAYDITEEVLRKVFDKCGAVRAVRFAEHIQTKEFRGFGYVQFHEEDACEAAIKLDGMVVMGRPMNVDYGARDEGFAKAREDLQRKLKKGICNKFQTGQCDRGDDCKFAHILQGQDAEELLPPADKAVSAVIAPGAAIAGAAVAAAAAVETAAPSDAPVCINFQKGKCKRGEACRFQHLGESAVVAEDADDVSVPADAPVKAEEPVEEATQADESSPVCQNYQKGKCKRGAACRFRHVMVPQEEEPAPTEWKAPVRVQLPAAVVAEVAVCQNFRRGRCTRGASCRFAHTEPKLQEAVEVVSEYQKRFQSICYNWQRSGSCARGDACPFQHAGGPQGDASGSQQQKEEEEDQQDEEAVEKKPKKSKKEKKEKKRKHREEEEAESDDDGKKKKSKKDKKKKSKHPDQD
jgi:RNA recognition motif-containing protein